MVVDLMAPGVGVDGFLHFGDEERGFLILVYDPVFEAEEG
jgi:hypothetical protein